MSSPYHHELKEKSEKHERKKYLMVDDYILDEVLGLINEIIQIKNMTIQWYDFKRCCDFSYMHYKRWWLVLCETVLEDVSVA